MLARVYDAYAETVMKNPFYTPEMPIRVEGFEQKITALIGNGMTS
jgi:trafficking protein particle complex subunit 4